MRTDDKSESPRPSLPGQLESERRRERVVEVLKNREPRLSLSELVDAVANEAGASTPVAAQADADADRVRVRLHHVDLPKLEERDVLEYDPARNVVSKVFENEGE